ncbi:MAG TPA: hypothetical protein VFL76_03425, partial [Edaphocola sp.]|nr:hypothetical protein [Edaphocola sp.]
AEGMEEAFGQSAGYDYSATVGNNSGTSSQTAGNYSNHNAGGDPPSEVGKGDSKSSTSDGTDASAIAVGGATGSFVSELTTGIEVTVDVTGAAIASGFATVALVFLPINTAAPSMEMRNIDPYGDPKNWKTEIPDKTNRIRPVYFNNKNYFPGGNGNDFIKWFVRFGAMGVTYKKFWYDPSHPDKH